MKSAGTNKMVKVGLETEFICQLNLNLNLKYGWNILMCSIWVNFQFGLFYHNFCWYVRHVESSRMNQLFPFRCGGGEGGERGGAWK